MTVTIGVNENNDIYIDPITGNLAMKTGIEALSDICLNVAKSQLGEMPLAVDQGIPNFQAVWVGNPNVAQFEAALRVALLTVDGVLAITELTATTENGILNYQVTILTIYGTTSINASI